ncbi:MAG: hypothetical protein BroJett040_14290 [Oligoflexia bacterium]|nr:MAG: hypothetical protein BroJett040_14290 [Oligoflexia bacterium]
MGVERYSSKTDVIVKLVLVFFISLLSFSIGTFVGKKFSDNQHKLSQFEPTEQNKDGESREVASVPADGHEVKPKDALSDDEIAKLAEEFVADDEHGKKPAAADGHQTDKNTEHQTEAKADSHAAPATPAATEHKPEPKAEAKPEHKPEPKKTAKHDEPKSEAKPSPIAAKIAEGKAPVEHKVAKTDEKSRIPQSLPREIASSPVGKYTVQIASYPDEHEAQKSASELKGKGFSAFYVTAKIKDKTWYRVSVGLFATQKEADTYKKELMEKAKVASAIVQKISN